MGNCFSCIDEYEYQPRPNYFISDEERREINEIGNQINDQLREIFDTEFLYTEHFQNQNPHKTQSPHENVLYFEADRDVPTCSTSNFITDNTDSQFQYIEETPSQNDIERKNSTSATLYSRLLIKNNAFKNHLEGVFMIKCSSDTVEYKSVQRHFMRTTQKHYKILEINNVFNPFLMAAYMLRKKEYELLYGVDFVREELVFHGTTSNKAIQIITNNFNWRFAGESKGHIFGQGVSFSPISNYASNYSDKKMVKKIMLGVKMLKSFECLGEKSTIIPPVCEYARNAFARFDTTIKSDGNVCVKYRDDEFYPAYLIVYTGSTVKRR